MLEDFRHRLFFRPAVLRVLSKGENYAISSDPSGGGGPSR